MLGWVESASDECVRSREWSWYQHARNRRGNNRSKRYRVRHPALTVELKVRLAGEQNWKCCCCGAEIGLKHHIEEAQKSARMKTATFAHLGRDCTDGVHSPENLAISCEWCNQNGVVRAMLPLLDGAFD